MEGIPFMYSMLSRRKIAALAAEFLGTGILAFVVLTISRSQIGLPYFVAIAAGLTVMILGLALERDVQFNPAYTLAMWTARRMGTLKAILFIAVQLLGAMAAFELYKFFSKTPVQPLPTGFDVHLLVAEAFGAFIFTFVAAGALFRKLSMATRAVVTGGGYILGVMVASIVAATMNIPVSFINPAVALSANAWAWSTYVAGPVLGAIIGVNLYSLLFARRDSDRATASVSSRVAVTKPKAADDESDASEAVIAHIEQDSEAVKPGRLDKLEKAEKEAKKGKSKKKR